MTNILFFEGCGMKINHNRDETDLTNFRFRTAFKNTKGTPVYLEMGINYRDEEGWVMFVYHFFEGYEETKDNRINVTQSPLKANKKTILDMVYEHTRRIFDDLQILENGYRVHEDGDRFNFMEELDV